jgi:putative addiction module component (TIGR02574 family)
LTVESGGLLLAYVERSRASHCNALALSENERLAVATALWESLKSHTDIPDEETADLISLGRARELADDTVNPVRHEDVFKRALSALK